MPKTLETSLDLASNLLGVNITENCKERIRAFFECPNRDQWDDIYSIIIHPNYTIWQAVCAVDPDFPRTGKRIGEKGIILRDWPQIPSAELVEKAIFYATH